MKLEIHPTYLPTRPPVQFTAILCLLCDRFSAPGWVWGGCITLITLLWIGAIQIMATTKWVKPSEIK